MTRNEQIDKGAEAIMQSLLATALNLREVEARALSELVLNAADPDWWSS